MDLGHSSSRTMKKMLLIGGSGGVGSALYGIINTDKYKLLSFSSKEYDVVNPTYQWDADIVIVLSGVTVNGLLKDINAQIAKIIDVNCLGAVNVLQTFLPGMICRNYGRIIFVSSIYSTTVVSGQGVYSATKAFVDRLVKNAAYENAQYGITVNSIQLGYMGLGMGKTDDIDKAISKTAMKRLCTIEELFRAIEFIIDTEYFTGQNLRLDGFVR